VPKNRDEKRALRVIRGHLERFWREDHGRELGDPDFRRLASVLSVRVMVLTDGGSDPVAAQILLSDLSGSPQKERQVWQALEREGQRLAEERPFLRRHTLMRRLEMQATNLRPVARLRPDIKRLRDLTQANMQTPAATLTISAPEGPVAVVREVE